MHFSMKGPRHCFVVEPPADTVGTPGRVALPTAIAELTVDSLHHRGLQVPAVVGVHLAVLHHTLTAGGAVEYVAPLRHRGIADQATAQSRVVADPGGKTRQNRHRRIRLEEDLIEVLRRADTGRIRRLDRTVPEGDRACKAIARIVGRIGLRSRQVCSSSIRCVWRSRMNSSPLNISVASSQSIGRSST